jgi:hypothetical protein
MELLALLLVSFAFLRLESESRSKFCFQSNKGGMAVTSVVVCEYRLFFMEQKFCFSVMGFIPTLFCACMCYS